MSSFKSFDLPAVHIQSGSLNLIFVLSISQAPPMKILRSSTSSPTSLSVWSSTRHPLIIVGDVNIHLDILSVHLHSNLSYIFAGAGLVQRVSGPTQPAGHTQDVIITTSALYISVTVESRIISVHSLTVAEITSGVTFHAPAAHVTKRQRASFYVNAFENGLAAS